MSGGSWDYAFGPIADIADALRNDTSTGSRRPLLLNDDQREWRRRLAAHLELVSAALHAIEWVDSDDTSYPSDVEAIKKVFDATDTAE
jgi:hypothetical protein